MEFKATPRTIRDALGLKRKYVIPRFQREYSWESEELDELWTDLLDNLEIKNGEILTKEYFIGSLVLVGDDDDTNNIERQVVDGQQRLMTFTIAFSVLAQLFAQENNKVLGDKIHKYIIDEDEDGTSYTKVISETPKPFFQRRIQQKMIDFSQIPNTEEEKRIFSAYKFFQDKMKTDNLNNDFRRISNGICDFNYVDELKAVRDQILNCKVIYVTVKSFDDAYTIFEVLNAKGKDLSSVDIIKNSIFSVLKSIEPIDDAGERWKRIRDNISQGTTDILTFYRHFWLSKYTFATNKRLVREFEKTITKNEDSYKEFLCILEQASEDYINIIRPTRDMWNQPEYKVVYNALDALSVFGVTQVRTFLLALFDIKRKNLVAHKVYLNIIEYLEYFHFVFNAICSERSSGLERKYSSYARKLRNSTGKEASKNVIGELRESLNNTLPTYEEFEKDFLKLKFSSSETKDKKLVQYVLKKLERYISSSDELTFDSFSIEHILPESTKNEYVKLIGNLLPLGVNLNSVIKDKIFKDKIVEYKKSQYQSVKEFVKKYSSQSSWGAEDIISRTQAIAKIMYNQVYE